MTRLIEGLAWLLLGVIALLAIWWAWNAGFGLFGSVISLVVAIISLRRSVKAFVESWRGRISQRVQIEVMAEKDAYIPGDTVNASVRVTGKEELGIEEGRAALVCANRYVYTYRTTDSDGHSDYRSTEVTEEVPAGDERILEKGTIRPGSGSEHGIVFEVPPTAPPSASGEITNVEWKIRVTLVIRGAPDVIEERPLTVLSSSESYANWAESAPELDASGACDMEFRLPGKSFRIGGRVDGSLVLTPRQDFGARGLRVELVRREIVPRASGNTRERVQATETVEEGPQYRAGMMREYPFSLEIPGASGPSLKTNQTYVGWWLRAVVDRNLAFDYELRQLLNVYNGPDIAAERCPECGAELARGARFCTSCGNAVSREGVSASPPREAPPEPPTAGGAITASQPAQQQPVFAPPQAPPSGPNRAQRKVFVVLFAAVAGLIFLSFFVVGLFFLLVLIAS
ncbi:MAG: zinc-ribbon domain-containing protein [Actinomycetota bacterium]|nr:zinc-ribbon domain-containing protein [Actinomycetota bacterium]